jgi:hypothetical protein
VTALLKGGIFHLGQLPAPCLIHCLVDAVAADCRPYLCPAAAAAAAKKEAAAAKKKAAASRKKAAAAKKTELHEPTVVVMTNCPLISCAHRLW